MRDPGIDRYQVLVYSVVTYARVLYTLLLRVDCRYFATMVTIYIIVYM